MKHNGHQMTATAVANEGFYALFGHAVCKAREKAGLTQAQLAEKIGVSRPSLVNIEKGRQGVLLHHGLELARVLDTPLPTLLKGAAEAARRAEIEHLELRLRELRNPPEHGPKHAASPEDV